MTRFPVDLAELGAARGTDAIAHGDDEVEVVIGYGLIRLSNVQIMHIAFAIQLSLGKNIIDVLGNSSVRLPALGGVRLEGDV